MTISPDELAIFRAHITKLKSNPESCYGLPGNLPLRTVNAILVLYHDALVSIASPSDCGCSPCRGACKSTDALTVELESRQEFAQAALDGHK